MIYGEEKTNNDNAEMSVSTLCPDPRPARIIERIDELIDAIGDIVNTTPDYRRASNISFAMPTYGWN